MHKAILYEKKEHDLVRCTACQNYCVIAKDTSGVCGVRRNIDGDLCLLVYGQASAANVDPIEKKPLYHVLPGESVFTIGTVGCNFSCQFCQNWDISQVTKGLRKKPLEHTKELLAYGYKLSPQDIIDICKKQRIPAVAFSYNEPAIFFEYAYDTMLLAKKEGIKTVFVSNGYASNESLDKLAGLLDAINIDLKSFKDEFYRKHSQARLQPVLDTIKRCHDLGIWVEVTTLFIPGENDAGQEMRDIITFIAGIDVNIPWHISAFHPSYKMLDKQPTPHETLKRAYHLGREKLHFVYVGNVHDPERSATYCPHCEKKVIERHGSAVHNSLSKQACPFCNTAIPGIFK
ncbi:MAG: AmmeMemoRadiSam system radical SAM enzyme [archaeon]